MRPCVMWSNSFSQPLELQLDTPPWLPAVLSTAGMAAALAWWFSGFVAPVRPALAVVSLCWGAGLALRWHRRRPLRLTISGSGRMTMRARAGGVPVPVRIPHWWRLGRLLALGWRAADGQSGVAIWWLTQPVADVHRRALVRLRLPQVTAHRVEWF